MAHGGTHRTPHGSVDGRIAPGQVLRTDTDEDLHPFARYAAEGGRHIGQCSSQGHNLVRSTDGAVVVRTRQAAVRLQVARGMPAETATRGRDAGHGRLDALCLGLLSALRAQATVLLHPLAEGLAADVGHELLERSVRGTFAPHAAETREAEDVFGCCFHRFCDFKVRQGHHCPCTEANHGRKQQKNSGGYRTFGQTRSERYADKCHRHSHGWTQITI